MRELFMLEGEREERKKEEISFIFLFFSMNGMRKEKGAPKEQGIMPI